MSRGVCVPLRPRVPFSVAGLLSSYPAGSVRRRALPRTALLRLRCCCSRYQLWVDGIGPKRSCRVGSLSLCATLGPYLALHNLVGACRRAHVCTDMVGPWGYY